MSTHSVNIIEISEVKPHGNAERLEIVPVNGWQAIVAKGQFKPGDRAVYIEPDYVVPTARPEFAFLAKDGKDGHRLKAVRLRGSLSFGLLIPVPAEFADCSVGDCIMSPMGIKRYEPPMKSFRGGGDDAELPEAEWPQLYAPKFDIENYQKFPDLIAPGELVVVTEKIHGANARYVWHDGKMFFGSRSRWLKPDVDTIWKRALTEYLAQWCEEHPDVVLYGEVFGPVQSLKYGLSEPRFVAFAALERDVWIDQRDLFRAMRDHAPVLFEGAFDLDLIKDLAEKDSTIGPAGHMMEGVVIVPYTERRDPEIGRVALKYISNRYWESVA